MISCIHPQDDVGTYNCQIVDTTYVSRNGFGSILGYDVIVQMDSSYYSAWMDKNGKLTDIHRKLKGLNKKW